MTLQVGQYVVKSEGYPIHTRAYIKRLQLLFDFSKFLVHQLIMTTLVSYRLGICPPLGDTSNIAENVIPVAAAEESFERGSNDSGTGTLKKGVTLAMGSSAMAAMRAKEHKLPEELDCERLSREVFLADAGGDLKLQSLFGKWKEAQVFEPGIGKLYKFKCTITRIEKCVFRHTHPITL